MPRPEMTTHDRLKVSLNTIESVYEAKNEVARMTKNIELLQQYARFNMFIDNAAAARAERTIEHLRRRIYG